MSSDTDTTVMTEPAKNGSIRRLFLLFLLTVLFSLPCYYLMATTGDTFFGWVIALTPLPAALILAFREETGGVKMLLRRYVRSIKMPKMMWYIPTILFMPAIWLLAEGVLGIFRVLPEPELTVSFLPILFIMALLTGSTEEIAWMGYAFDPLQAKWKTIRATLMLAVVWILWHLPGFYLFGSSAGYMVIFSILMVAWRFLMVWIYKNTGKSVFAASLVHATGNVTISYTTFVNVAAVGLLGVMIASGVTMIAALLVIWVWGPELNKFRFSKAEQVS